MLKTAVISFIMGALIYVGTAAILGKKKANTLPGGAVGVAFFVAPWYIALIFALIGHVAAILLAKKF